MIFDSLMTTFKTYKIDKLDDIKRQLEAEPARAENEMRLAQAIGYLRPSLYAKLKEGWTREMLAEWLGQRGLEVTPRTLRDYLRRASAKRRKASKKTRQEKQEETKESANLSLE